MNIILRNLPSVRGVIFGITIAQAWKGVWSPIVVITIFASLYVIAEVENIVLKATVERYSFFKQGKKINQ